MAFSNERMVSSGRSNRGLVGLERSGSAATWISPVLFRLAAEGLTDGIAVQIQVLDVSEILERRQLVDVGDFARMKVSRDVHD